MVVNYNNIKRIGQVALLQSTWMTKGINKLKLEIFQTQNNNCHVHQ